MTINKAAAILSLAIFSLSTSAYAELQTWRLTATSYQVQNGFTPPPFADVGDSFNIDYVIDTSTPAQSNLGSLFNGAINSFTVNGISSQSGGYVIADDGFNAINIWPLSARVDGVEFISLNNFRGKYASDVTSALRGFSTMSTDLRIDFGEQSIWAKPSSFVMLPVPEPSSTLLLMIGLPLIMIRKYRKQK